MAIFKCPECKNKISDKASICPKCGYLITRVPENIEIELSPRKKAKVKKIAVISLIIIFVIVVGMLIITIIAKQHSNGLYRGIEWGSTVDEVENKLGNEEKEIQGESISQFPENYEGIENATAWVNYHFNEGGLYWISVAVSSENASEEEKDKVAMAIYDKLVKRYGKCDKISDDQEYIWNTQYSEITLSADHCLINYKKL